MKKKVIALLLTLLLVFCAASAWAEPGGDAMVGVFHGVEDSYSKLRILPDGDAYAVTIDIYRLVGLEYSAEYRDGALRGVSDIQGDFSATVEITPDGAGLKVSIADSSWELLPAGTVLGFLPGAPDIDADTFSFLFEEYCTGFAGTAGSSLKAASAASALLETAVYNDAAYCDLDRLCDSISEALAGLDADTRADLDETLPGILSLVEDAFSDYDSVRGLFDSAGADTDMSFSLSDPLSYDDWRTLHTALAMALGA